MRKKIKVGNDRRKDLHTVIGNEYVAFLQGELSHHSVCAGNFHKLIVTKNGGKLLKRQSTNWVVSNAIKMKPVRLRLRQQRSDSDNEDLKCISS